MNRFFGSWRSVLMAIALTTTGCGYLIYGGFAGENQVTIENIKSSKDNDNSPIQVEGTITKVIPLVNKYAYEIKDNTASIWVVTKGEKPEVGQQISTSATIHREEIVIGEEDMSSFYLQEVMEEEEKNEEINQTSETNSQENEKTPEEEIEN